jgi:1-acyl-sn-glycerol-3-phosphate acyltransferase
MTSSSSIYFTCLVCAKEHKKHRGFVSTAERARERKAALETLLCVSLGIPHTIVDKLARQLDFQNFPFYCRSCSPWFKGIEEYQDDIEFLEKEVIELQQELLNKLRQLNELVQKRNKSAARVKEAVIESIETEDSRDKKVPRIVSKLRRLIIECKTKINGMLS